MDIQVMYRIKLVFAVFLTYLSAQFSFSQKYSFNYYPIDTLSLNQFNSLNWLTGNNHFYEPACFSSEGINFRLFILNSAVKQNESVVYNDGTICPTRFAIYKLKGGGIELAKEIVAEYDANIYGSTSYKLNFQYLYFMLQHFLNEKIIVINDILPGNIKSGQYIIEFLRYKDIDSKLLEDVISLFNNPIDFNRRWLEISNKINDANISFDSVKYEDNLFLSLFDFYTGIDSFEQEILNQKNSQKLSDNFRQSLKIGKSSSVCFKPYHGYIEDATELTTNYLIFFSSGKILNYAPHLGNKKFVFGNRCFLNKMSDSFKSDSLTFYSPADYQEDIKSYEIREDKIKKVKPDKDTFDKLIDLGRIGKFEETFRVWYFW